MTILEQAGLDHYLQQQQLPPPTEPVGRISAEFGTAYAVIMAHGEAEAIAPKTLIARNKPSDRPKTGDWVTLDQIGTEAKYRIRTILPRSSELTRKRTGKRMEAQVLAVNVDTVFITESAAAELDLDRIERFLTVPNMAHIAGRIIITKCDTVTTEQVEQIRTKLLDRFPQIPVHFTSTLSGAGLAELRAMLTNGTTAAVIGPSGVGKSSLINTLLGSEQLRTQSVRDDDQKGRHTTTVRELLVLPSGGVIIDTPGMRELQLWGDAATKLDTTFADVEILTRECRFSDCDHVKSAGCAIQNAIQNGTLDPQRFASFQKLKRELEQQTSTHNYETALNKKRKEKKLSQTLRTIGRHKRGKTN
ncbi:MAG: ribosome small subunit-dependent GTPase A [Candidatus Doudnabacteria bacterium]|nr:ribosome small subunit-dependent GTPase A [Candidatus Doudnabacteria bacterium]